MCYEQKDGGNLMEGEQGLGSSEEDNARVEDAATDANNEHGVANQIPNGVQISQQSQNSVIRWERFLPIRSLKVLLVENDDSTRHVVSALLRNCSYEVTAVSNGLQAWKILEDINNHIDLILTEVVMPILSGIGLLCKIMHHKSLKNIPVIMMSSQDSIGVVFKCLSKGAVDFLVKPIRKNELKNLWQHVWRRCHSSSGSGSESGTGKSPKSRSNEEFEKNSDSSEELDDNGSNGQSNCGGSDNGSGTQSSWTKRAAEYDSLQAQSPSYQLAVAPGSTCAQVIHTKPETPGNRWWVHVGETKVCQEKDEKLDDIATGKDLEAGTSRNAEIQHDRPCENLLSQTTSKRQNKFSEADSKPLENGQLEHSSVNLSIKTRDPSPKTDGIISNYLDPHAGSGKLCDLNSVSDVSQLKDKAQSGCGESPSLQLGLTRAGIDGGNAANESLSVLKHSDLSAFSKYNTASSANQGPTGNAGSCSPLDNSSAAIKMETVHNFPFHLSGIVVNQQSNGSSNNNDLASTAKNVPSKLEASSDKLESSSAFKSFHSSAFQPVQNGHTCLPQQPSLGNLEDVDVDVDTLQLKFRGSHQQIRVQHHHHHHHHYHHHVHKMQKNQPQADHDDLSLKNMAAAAPQCGSSNVVGGPTEANVGNYSMNGSASGSNHGSNGQNGGSTALNLGLTNIESEHRVVGNSTGCVGGRTCGNVLDEDRAAQREAALSKFRQKRKERCFEKRVRYQSRKRLAEQRPRVKGQFVRQPAPDIKTERDCQSNDVTSEDYSSDNVR